MAVEILMEWPSNGPGGVSMAPCVGGLKGARAALEAEISASRAAWQGQRGKGSLSGAGRRLAGP